jgi:DNA-directed RNA polymerase subunit beta
VHADSCIPQLLAAKQHRSSEGRILAASRPAKTSRTSSAYAPRRISFGRITEQLEVPNLLAIQTESFDWLVGNEAWQARSTDDPHAHSGLAEILEEISPIEDFSGTMSLSFSAPRFDEVKASIEECKEKDLTYCAPLFVTAEFTNNTTGEIKSQTVFMGDFPMMTPKGTFVINGTERVVVSQLVRSPASRSSRAGVPGWSSTSTSATRSVSGSIASAGRP